MSSNRCRATRGRSPRWWDQTAELTEAFAGKDEELGGVITDLNTVVANLARHNDDLDHIVEQARSVVTTFDARRPQLVESMGSMAKVVRQLSAISDEVYPQLNEMVEREPGFAQHMLSIEPQLAFVGANLPLMLKGFARITGEGSYANAYACNLDGTAFLPGLNDITPIIVAAATPGNKARYTPKCRNLANG